MKDCNQCGKCCIKYGNGGLSAAASEVEYWETFRPNIYDYVGGSAGGNLNGTLSGADSGEKIWISPDTGKQLERCPWLRQVPNQDKTNLDKSSRIQYTCDIYYDRPDDCKHYPVTIEQMVADKCEMIEVRDLDNPQQAQLTLDKLMVESRPSLS
ncbi:MAG: YkgJ family cysteine cluster protein [Gammaproteobacteria bacterium]|nr:MAG: YkgJ family cysteine cluster protein [Gammaproteobacteria bacterium]RLA51878.1 MAG: YkgJ family cysteine cluster protein [Gammaproteobacteria bacterium]